MTTFFVKITRASETRVKVFSVLNDLGMAVLKVQ